MFPIGKKINAIKLPKKEMEILTGTLCRTTGHGYRIRSEFY